eukprot:6169512-Prymnesium_polylepis.1
MPFAAYGLGLAVFGCAERCRVIAAGGHSTTGFTNIAAIYEHRDDLWSLVPPLPSARFGLRMLAQPSALLAYAVGGLELRLQSHTSATASAAHASSMGS